MPSLAIVTLDIELTDDGARELGNMQGRGYIGELTLRSLLKWDRGHSEKPADWVRTQAISFVDRSPAIVVEEVLRPFIEPGLFSRSSRELPKLPALETSLFNPVEPLV